MYIAVNVIVFNFLILTFYVHVFILMILTFLTVF